MLLRLKALHLGMSGDITFVVLNFRDKKKGKKEFSVQILPCLAYCPADAVEWRNFAADQKSVV